MKLPTRCDCGAAALVMNCCEGERKKRRNPLPLGGIMRYYKPSRLGMSTAQAARLAKKLNEAAGDSRLVACITPTGKFAVDADFVCELRAKGQGCCLHCL
jgi:hypothetical protein